MNYPLYYSIKKWLVEKEYKVNDFANDLIKYRGNYQKESYHCLWNFVDTHDTPRFSYLAEDQKTSLLGAALTLTLPGSPLIYYGDEVGLTGGKDPDCRRGMLWDEAQNPSILSFYKKLIELRKAHPALLMGDLKIIDTFNRYNILIYSRFTDDEEIKIIINASDVIQSNPIKGIELISNEEAKEYIPPKTIWIIK